MLKNETENSYYKVITKCDRSLLQSASGITKCDRLLLQSASGITKCDRLLLQSAPGITNCDSYYKVRRNTCAFKNDMKDLAIFHRLKNTDFNLESKMTELNQNKNSKQTDRSDAV